MRVGMFVYNRCTTDVRVLREAATLRAAGHEVTIFAVLDPTTELTEVLVDGTRIIRINRRPLHYRLAWFVRGRRRAIRLGTRRAVRRSVAGTVRTLRRTRRLVRRLLRPLRILRPPRPSRPMRSGAVPVSPERRTLGTSRAIELVLLPLAPPGLALAWLSTSARKLLYRAHKPLMYTDFWGRAFRAARRGNFDVVHAHDLNTLPVAALLARDTGARLVYDAHELYPDVSTLSPLERRVWLRLEPPLIRRADRVLTVCESIAEELVHRYDIPKPRVLLNCPPAQPPVDPRLSPLRAAVGLIDEPATAIVLYQGGFAPNRGLPELVRAMHAVDGAVLVLMGWGRLEAELAALVGTEDLEGRVRIIPPVSAAELQAWSCGADLGVIPYQPVGLNNTYSTPNKLFEYIAAGLPIAATRLPEITRIVEGHGIGATFAHVTPGDIANVVNGILGDPDARAQMRERTLAIRHQYTWDRQSGELVALYESLGARYLTSSPSSRTMSI